MAELTLLQNLGIATGVVSGIIGATLGVVNALNYYLDNRPRVRVRFGIRSIVDRTRGPGGPVEDNVGVITITNVGRLTVVPDQLGIERREGPPAIVVSPVQLGGGNLLEDLGPGRARYVRCNAPMMIEDARAGMYVRGWVRTQAGDVFYGTRKEMRTFVKELLTLEERLRGREPARPA